MVALNIYYLSLVLVAIVFFFLGVWFYRLILWYPRGGKSVTGSKMLIGKVGQVISDNGSNNVVRVDGQNWNAKNMGQNKLEVGDKVVVKQVSGLYLIVEKVSNGN
jgi:Membrane-bound serine protease (ClpP class)